MTPKRMIAGLLTACLAVALSACAKNPADAARGALPEGKAAQATSTGLILSTEELSETPRFIDYEAQGTAMQLIAIKDDGGTVRMAYNTCQICAGSPYAYFEWENNQLACRNCGNTFALSAVGRTRGGCNPWPLTDYETDGDSLTVAEETLTQMAPAFRNWKVFS